MAEYPRLRAHNTSYLHSYLSTLVSYLADRFSGLAGDVKYPDDGIRTIKNTPQTNVAITTIVDRLQRGESLNISIRKFWARSIP